MKIIKVVSCNSNGYTVTTKFTVRPLASARPSNKTKQSLTVAYPTYLVLTPINPIFTDVRDLLNKEEDYDVTFADTIIECPNIIIKFANYDYTTLIATESEYNILSELFYRKRQLTCIIN